jgi:Rps23 Pro-64 3,4-dihydroxylase Tpa1-like proline 4-hydroxylase
VSVTAKDRAGVGLSEVFLDRQRLEGLAVQLAPSYRLAHPFPHVVIDDFVDELQLDAVLSEFPDAPANPRSVLELKKSAIEKEGQLGEFTRLFLAQFNSAVFLTFLEQLTAISGLVPDPHYLGGGLHQTQRGGYLKIHADFNVHKQLLLDRRLNLILYLNRDWSEEFGGHLELWNREMTRCERRILPVFNRCVIFSTTDYSYHGHPEPLQCPEGTTRKSVALYYYTNGRPAGELSAEHTTLFKARPGEVLRRPPGYSAKVLARRLLPPILVDGLNALRSRARRRA